MLVNKSVKLLVIFIFILFLLSVFNCNKRKSGNIQISKSNEKQPNIIIIYMDDLGYGDTSCYGAKDLITSNIDKLAEGGIRFTRGYSTSATCTPSRYALLTGIYPWKKENVDVLQGTAPLLINTQQITLPKMLKSSGYQTGIVGKWHLGLGTGNLNWNDTISPGPNEVGFDYSYILAATQDRVPTVYIKNGLVDNLDPEDPIFVNYEEHFSSEPTGLTNPELLKMNWHHGHNNSIVNGIPRIGFMKGGATAKWIDEAMAYKFLEEAKSFVVKNKKSPFFLYYSMQQPHVPRTPAPEFVGRSGLGPRGDVILEADWCIGELYKTLQEEKLLENTLIIFSSDNGPVLNDGYYDEAVEKKGNHKPQGVLRGGKYSLFEAGTRVPFIVYWKDHIDPGVSDAIVCQIDLLASLAKLVGYNKIPNTDSVEMMKTLMGETLNGRDNLIIESMSRTALVQKDWVLIPPNSGEKIIENVNIESGFDSEYQLYNIKNDIQQSKNINDLTQIKRLNKIYESIRFRDSSR